MPDLTDSIDQSDTLESDTEYQEESDHVETITTTSGYSISERHEEFLDLLNVYQENEKLLANLTKEKELLYNGSGDDVDDETPNKEELSERIESIAKHLLDANTEVKSNEILLQGSQVNDRKLEIFGSGPTGNERDRESPSGPMPKDFKILLQRLKEASYEQNDLNVKVKQLQDKLVQKKHNHYNLLNKARELMSELKIKLEQLEEKIDERSSDRIKELKQQLKEKEKMKQLLDCLLEDVTKMTNHNWGTDQTTKNFLFTK